MHATLFVIIGLIFGLLAALMAFGITYVECESISSWVGSCGRSHCVDVHVGVLSYAFNRTRIRFTGDHKMTFKMEPRSQDWLKGNILGMGLAIMAGICERFGGLQYQAREANRPSARRLP